MKTFQIPGTKKEVVNSNDIVCFVADGRTCYLLVITDVLRKQYRKITSSHNLGHYKTLLAGTTLFTAHHNCIINLEQVESYDSSRMLKLKICLSERLKIAKGRFKEFKKELDLVRGLLK